MHDSALVYGTFGAEQSDSIQAALARASVEARFCRDPDAASRMLESSSVPGFVVVDTVSPGAEPVVRWLRAAPGLWGMPLVGLVPHPTSALFEEAHELGADAVVPCTDLGALTRQAGVLVSQRPAARTPVCNGAIIVAHPNDARRRELGRIGRGAGFDVLFASSRDELMPLLASEPARIVVSCRSLLPEPAADACTTISRVGGPVWIIVAPLGTLSREATELGGVPGVVFMSELAPATNLLFVMNEVMRGTGVEARASKRFLFGTLCAFRRAGRLDACYGLTYNLSNGGLYIRGIEGPPPSTPLWVELRPPGQQSVVQLRGEVVWRRPISAGPNAALSPAGFGFRIDPDETPASDLRDYATGYAELAADASRWPDRVYIGHSGH